MKMTGRIQPMNQSCAKCPYKLGLVQALINPCPQCKENGYQMFDYFQQEHQGKE